ncbi:MAG: hypothetical protein BWY82_01255 [Verrucomicrobia bacterium ADurb.Bin474]|nr:MAG: hypothetical protein BWY82_01255 [Verrucomicrobia bacterium ADurb.Bin474]
MIFFAIGLTLISLCRSSLFETASSSEILRSSGTMRAMRLASAKGTSFTLAKSLTMIFAPKQLKVMMLATRSAPYFSRT